MKIFSENYFDLFFEEFFEKSIFPEVSIYYNYTKAAAQSECKCKIWLVLISQHVDQNQIVAGIKAFFKSTNQQSCSVFDVLNSFHTLRRAQRGIQNPDKQLKYRILQK